MRSFEQLREELAGLNVPAGEARQLIWVTQGRLGAAMTAGGAFELFLVGPPIQATLPLVANNLHHDRWEPSAGGEPFEASRVLLGPAAHFAAVAALIAVELGRLDLSSDGATQRSFNEVEPIIELAIRRAALSSEAILGLIAELHVLRAVFIAVEPDKRARVLLGWRGWAPGRDFVLGVHGIEVKATVGLNSRHKFSGIHQLEAQPFSDGSFETVHLLSIGFEHVTAGGINLPELVEELLSLIGRGDTRTAEQVQLLNMISLYGGNSAPGYDHDEMRGWSAYHQRFSVSFARLYDVVDPKMLLLRRENIEQSFAIPDSVSFELAIPQMVSAFNPAENWQSQIAVFARAS